MRAVWLLKDIPDSNTSVEGFQTVHVHRNCREYVPPSANALLVIDVIHSVIVRLQTQYLNAFITISGDFNHITISGDFNHITLSATAHIQAVCGLSNQEK